MSNKEAISNKNKIHIITSFAVRDGFDLIPTKTAIERACAMNSVLQIHILSETTQSEAELALPFLSHPKIIFITTSRRPTFAQLFDYANKLEINESTVVALMNSDISFSEESDIKKSVRLLDLAREKGYHAILTITRHEIVEGKPELTLYDRTGLPNCVTCDCWVFRPPLPPIGLEYVNLGDMNCDSIIAYNMSEAGYCLINPCIDITLIHHEDVKNNEYYDALNRKNRSVDLLGWHWAKQCNRPYKTYGVPWTTSAAVESGYLPVPLVYQKKRIYLTLPEKSNTSVLAVVALTEVIARTHERDLVILLNDIEEWGPTLAEQFGVVSRNVYFITVESHNAVIDSLISEDNWYGESCALIARFDYLTSELIKEFHSIIFDARQLDFNNKIYAPVGHKNLKTFSDARYQNINFTEKIIFQEKFNDEENCTLVTSIFRSDNFLDGFNKNITALNGYERSPHILLFSTITERERSLLNRWHYDHNNTILCWFRTDPGLYECWNIGIRISQTVYVSNANVDDLRHPNHVKKLVEELQLHSTASIAATAVVSFHSYVDDLTLIDQSSPWYTDQAGIFQFEDLAHLEKCEDGSWKLNPHNIPHCMPVWRKSLHDKYGYFDEAKYGTYADWAYWLKVTKAGEIGYLSKEPYTFYYVNQSSHNRRGDQLARLHKTVEKEFIADFYFRKKIDIKQSEDSQTISTSDSSDQWPKKLFLEGLSQSFGQHRNSFNRLIETLRPLHNEAGGVRFIPFIERYFVWGTDDGEAASSNPRPILQDWIGILHVPFDAPKWFEYSISPECIFNTELWRKSFPKCRGIICLSEYLKRDLLHWYPNLPTLVVKHPTELDVIGFDYSLYEQNPRLVQAGDWLRRLQFIYEIDAPGHKKIFLKKQNTDFWLKKEIECHGDFRNDSVNVLNFVSNEEYDQLLSTSVVVAWLYATAANNIVLECIARKTPILINPLPSIVEYLGKDYPLYLTDINKGRSFLSDSSRIKAAHLYLKRNEHLSEKLSYSKFLKDVVDSEFYQKI